MVDRRTEDVLIAIQQLEDLVNTASPQLFANAAVDTLERQLGYTLAAVLIRDDAGHLAPLALSDQGRGEEFRTADASRVTTLIGDGKGITNWVARSGEVVSVGAAPADPRYLDVRSDVLSELCVPIRVEREVVGCLNVESTVANSYQAVDRQVLAIIAAQLGNQLTVSRARSELARLQRAEIFNHINRGLLHDLNNLLTVMTLSCETLPTEPHDPRIVSHVSLMQTAGASIQRLTRQLLCVASPPAVQQASLRLNTLIESLLPVLVRLAGSGVELLLRLDATNDSLVADRTELEQVLMNLVVNAGQAMTTTKVLSIRTANGVDPETGRSKLTLRVSDSGCGMSSATLAKLFKTSFTTKAAGHGIGLVTVHRIVRSLGGRLDVRSQVDHGTTFTVSFDDSLACRTQAC